MKPYLVVAFLLVFGAGAAIASAYSELSLGIDAYKQQDWEATILHMSNALAAPDLPPGYRVTGQFDRGDAYLEIGKPDLAISDYSAVIAADPDYLDALQHRAKVYAVFRKFDLAIADYSVLITKRPSVPQLYADRGGYYMAVRKFDLAAADFTQIVTWRPKNSVGYEMRGNAYRRMAKYDDALTDLNKAIALDDVNVDAYQYRAELYNYEANYAAAQRDYEKVLSIDPRQSNARYNLGTTFWFEGHYAEAAKTLSEFLTQRPHDLYGMLWNAISAGRNDPRYLDTLRAQASAEKLTAWPGQIVSVYLGTQSPEGFLKITPSLQGGTRESNICEADFFVAESYLLAGNKPSALPLLQEAQSVCPQYLAAYFGTVAELKRLQ